MMTRLAGNSRLLALVPAFAMLAAMPAHAQQGWNSLDDFLTNGIRLSGTQLAAVARGEVVAKILPTSDARDVAVFGVVQVNATREQFIKRQSDFPRSLSRAGRSQVHLFRSPATDADVQALEVTAEEVTKLRACRANSCDFKLPATEMDRARAAIDWSAPDVRARVSAYARQRVLALVGDYRRLGNAAMVVYDDHGGVHASDAFAAMLRDSSWVFRVSPSLAQHLLDFPRTSLPGANEVMFWSLDEMSNAQATLQVTHESVYSPPEVPGTTIMAAKQIYADHYVEAGLETLTAVDRREAGATANAGITVIAIRRYRFDNLPGGVLNVRGRVVNGLRDQVVADLARLKEEQEGAKR